MSFFRTISLSALFVLFLRIPLGLGGEDLIAPTRTLEGREELLGSGLAQSGLSSTLGPAAEPPDRTGRCIRPQFVIWEQNAKIPLGP